MKSLSIFAISCLSVMGAFAQTISNVTININGNKNRQIEIDGKTYTINNTTAAGKSIITITDLMPGQHTLLLKRSNQNNGKFKSLNTTFNLRSGYDLSISINGNGSISQREKKQAGNIGQYKTPMSDANFSRLLSVVRNQWRSSSRKAAVSNAFANTSNYFTSSQAMQLIQLISNQSQRLELAKASYRSITDPSNFGQVTNLLTTEANRNALDVYVASYIAANGGYTYGGNGNTATDFVMSEATYNNLYRDVQNQTTNTSRYQVVLNSFNNSFNRFTTLQVSQLIQLIQDEDSRFTLAKTAYARVVDPVNYGRLADLLPSQYRKNELMMFINNNNSTSTVKVPMSSSLFNNIFYNTQSMNAAARVPELWNVFGIPTYNFSTSQVQQLIGLVADEYNRLPLAKAAYRNVTDQLNYTQLYALFSSQANRDDLATYIRNYNPNGPVYTNPGTGTTYPGTGTNTMAMADVDYNRLYAEIDAQWLPFAQMTALNNTFANSSYYFNTAQAKKLILLVSSETNRLTLAKAAYRNITDPANFNQLYDLFTTQATRDELAAYVNANRKY